MLRAIARFCSLLVILTALSSCAAVSFVTDCCKAHFINESSHAVTITSTEPGEKTKVIVLKPGKKKMISYGGSLGTWSYSPEDLTRYDENTESWYDVNFGISRSDTYYRFSDS